MDDQETLLLILEVLKRIHTLLLCLTMFKAVSIGKSLVRKGFSKDVSNRL